MMFYIIMLKLNKQIFIDMNQKILNEINRQRKIMGLSPVLIKEETGLSSIGEFFADAIKALSKETGLLDDAGQMSIRLGDNMTFTKKQFDELVVNLRSGNYSSVSDDVLDGIAALLRNSSDADGNRYVDRILQRFDELSRQQDPQFNLDTFISTASREVNNGSTTIDNVINTVCGNNPILRKTIGPELTSRIQKGVDDLVEASRRAAEEAQTRISVEAERLRRTEQGRVIERLRNRVPGAADRFTPDTWIRYWISINWSPLTKFSSYYDIPRLIEEFVNMFKGIDNLDDEINKILDLYESMAQQVFDLQKAGETDIVQWMSSNQPAITSLITRLDAIKEWDTQWKNVAKEVIEMYKRNPELDTLGKETKEKFIAEFTEMIDRFNPSHPDFKTWVPTMIDMFGGKSFSELKARFDKDVLERISPNGPRPPKTSWQKTLDAILNLPKLIFKYVEGHFFTGMFKLQEGFNKFMADRPTFKFITSPTKNEWKLGKYYYWWFMCKLVVAPAVGAFIAILESFNIFKPIEVLDPSPHVTVLFFQRTWKNIQKKLAEGFGDYVEVEIVDVGGVAKKEIEFQFSIWQSLWPADLTFDLGLDVIKGFLAGTIQQSIRNFLIQKRDEATETIEQLPEVVRQRTEEIYQEGEVILDSINVETPEIDSTLLRQQPGPVEGSDDPNSPNYSYELLINAWNNANQNDKITGYNTSGNKATYKGKNGTVVFNGEGVMIFVSDDRSVKKRFDGYTSGGTQR